MSLTHAHTHTYTHTHTHTHTHKQGDYNAHKQTDTNTQTDTHTHTHTHITRRENAKQINWTVLEVLLENFIQNESWKEQDADMSQSSHDRIQLFIPLHAGTHTQIHMLEEKDGNDCFLKESGMTPSCSEPWSHYQDWHWYQRTLQFTRNNTTERRC